MMKLIAGLVVLIGLAGSSLALAGDGGFGLPDFSNDLDPVIEKPSTGPASRDGECHLLDDGIDLRYCDD